MKASHCQSRPHSHTYAEWFESSVTSFDVQDAEERPFKMRLRHPLSLSCSLFVEKSPFGDRSYNRHWALKLMGLAVMAEETQKTLQEGS